MSEARHEAVPSHADAAAPGADPAEGGRKSRSASRAPEGPLGGVVPAATPAKSGVHSTDALQRDAFTRDALRRMVPTTRPPANVPAYEAAALVDPAEGQTQPESTLARARRELLRMAGEDLPVAEGTGFADEEVTTQRAQPFLLAASSRGSRPQPDSDSREDYRDRDEDTVIQDVSELLAAADAQLDALTTEIRSVITPLPPPLTPNEHPRAAEEHARTPEPRAAEPASQASPTPEPQAVAQETPLVTSAQLAVLVRQTAREAPAPGTLTARDPAPTNVAAPTMPASRSGARRATYAALLAASAIALVSVARPTNRPHAPKPSLAAQTEAAKAAPAASQAETKVVPPAAEQPRGLLAALQRADEPRVASSGERAATQVTRGQAALRAGQPRAARALLAAAAAREPLNPHAYAGMSEADLLLGQPERALVAAQSALKLRPRRSRYHLLVARVYDALGRPEDAAESRRQAQIVAPYDPDQPGRADAHSDD